MLCSLIVQEYPYQKSKGQRSQNENVLENTCLLLQQANTLKSDGEADGGNSDPYKSACLPRWHIWSQRLHVPVQYNSEV